MRQLQVALIALLFVPALAQAGEQLPVGFEGKAPPGWIEFCVRYAPECDTQPMEPKNVVLSNNARRDLMHINAKVNQSVKPLSDLNHWGVEDRWDYPTDGYGDCEDYVLEKRRLLMKAGWPRQALLITVVYDKNWDGHAVLTVETDRGEFVLDNQRQDILLWNKTGYRFVKIQSQEDPNVWLMIWPYLPNWATLGR